MTEVVYNVGFTYSNYILLESIIVVGILDSEELSINTISHEARHLLLHIANYRGLDLNSEDVCYLLGSIVQTLYSIYKYGDTEKARLS